MAGVERIVPIITVSDPHTALNFYCSVLGFKKDFHYRPSPDGPDYVGVSLNGHQLHLSTFSGHGNQTWGEREVYVRDPDGNTLRFGSPRRGR